ncbi:MAG: IS200/IS605 family transposase [Bacteroidota bacterium]|nr:IS200/IS605 family transposase [Bacteroidota bacterium]
MPGTFSKIYIQVVFAVKYREAIINESWESRLFQYISGIIKEKEQKLIAINGMPDHIHIFIGMKPSCNLSDLVREIKKSSTQFVNENKFSKHKFQWQEGYGAFSYGHSQIDVVAKYVMNQKEHHKRQSFKNEYIQFLQNFEVEFDEKFLFNWFD